MICKFLAVLLVCSAFANVFPQKSELQNAESDVGNNNVLEGDIMLDKSTLNIIENLKSDTRDAVTNLFKHWPNGRVAYDFGTITSCVDRNTKCPRWKSYCHSIRWYRFMIRECKRTCGKC